MRQPVGFFLRKYFRVQFAEKTFFRLAGRRILNPGVTQLGVLVENHDRRIFQRDTKAFLAVAQRFLGRRQFFFVVDLVQGARHDGGQKIQKIFSFDQIIERTAFHHLDGHALIALSSDDEERRQAAEFGQLGDDFVGLEILELQIE